MSRRTHAPQKPRTSENASHREGSRKAASPPTHGGRALDHGIRSALEPRLGHSFADVTVHADASSDALTSALGTEAFAYGEHVYFADGAYDPSTPSGAFVLAHELAHVVQQSGPESASTIRQESADEGAANATAAHLLGLAPSAAPLATGSAAVQTFNPPDLDFLGKTAYDMADTADSFVSAVPLVGNVWSAEKALAGAGVGGLYSATGDQASADNAFRFSENNALNAIPGIGNYRAMIQAMNGAGTVAGDFRGDDPNTNLTPGQKFRGRDGDKFNKQVGGVVDDGLGLARRFLDV